MQTAKLKACLENVHTEQQQFRKAITAFLEAAEIRKTLGDVEALPVLRVFR
jgi:hypothetical protein